MNNENDAAPAAQNTFLAEAQAMAEVQVANIIVNFEKRKHQVSDYELTAACLRAAMQDGSAETLRRSVTAQAYILEAFFKVTMHEISKGSYYEHDLYPRAFTLQSQFRQTVQLLLKLDAAKTSKQTDKRTDKNGDRHEKLDA